MAGKYVLKSARGGRFRFNLYASNGQVILTSEAYESLRAARDGIAAVRKHSAADDRFDRKTAKNDKPYFLLTAPSGDVIGQSQMYTSRSAMEKGVRSVQVNGPNAKVEEDLDTEAALPFAAEPPVAVTATVATSSPPKARSRATTRCTNTASRRSCWCCSLLSTR